MLLLLLLFMVIFIVLLEIPSRFFVYSLCHGGAE